MKRSTRASLGLIGMLLLLILIATRIRGGADAPAPLRSRKAPATPELVQVPVPPPSFFPPDSKRPPESVQRPPAPTERPALPPPSPAPLAGLRPGYMGLNGSDAPGGGVLVTQIFPYTAAERADLRAGDVLLEFNDRIVPDLNTLFSFARNAGEGAPVSLRIRRAGSEFYLGLQLGRHPLFN